MEVKPTEETIEVETDSDLPNDYQPVPKEDWLSKKPTEVPAGVAPNAEADKESSNETPAEQERSEP
jgi:hypothetical protein